MTKLYQVINYAFQTVKTFESLDAAKSHVDELRTAFNDEGFYVVEQIVAYSSFPANSSL